MMREEMEQIEEVEMMKEKEKERGRGGMRLTE